ncbi:S41 family peptidase [Lysinibacillus sp. SGAir0095]|uniref:S41 family peptidase n=1 Tax=Lysinibacillus sp. SGAir0095 TaxID=2070463 RepID=UPI0010CD4643|nr:S41 family peptidase [Lysinibacillus sp. SGAir0095]QCR31475.1 peptidase S41 [Lysinibacillus sp. SGAir0095]
MKKYTSMLLSVILLLLLPFQTFAATLDDIKTIIRSDYVGPINGNLNSAKTIEEAIAMLDPYSDYFTKEEYESYMDTINNASAGLGIVIQKHEKGILIVEVVNKSSSSQSTFQVGDLITEVNGLSTVEMSVEEVQALLLNEENTMIEMKILKTNGTTVTESIQLRSSSLPNVNTKLLYDNVGYISLNSFSEDGAQLVANAYTKLLNQGATSFIVDLQNNGGGYVLTAERLIGMFPGALYAYKMQSSTSTSLIKAKQQGIVFPTRTRLLVNRYSASASEMTAAALLDQQSAILYGEQTYGKGTMQSFYTFPDGSVLKLTIAEFFGPKGTIVKDIGIKPNIITASNPLYSAHFDQIVENLETYKQLPSLTNVPTTKTFTIHFNKEITAQIESTDVEIVQLGGTAINASIEVSGKQLVIKPSSPLQKGREYMVIIKPTIKDKNGRPMIKGHYLKVTVQK